MEYPVILIFGENREFNEQLLNTHITNYQFKRTSCKQQAKKLLNEGNVKAAIISCGGEGAGDTNRVKRFKISFPELPVFCSIESPSKEFLKFAIREGIADVLEYEQQITPEELAQCLNRYMLKHSNNRMVNGNGKALNGSRWGLKFKKSFQQYVESIFNNGKFSNNNDAHPVNDTAALPIPLNGTHPTINTDSEIQTINARPELVKNQPVAVVKPSSQTSESATGATSKFDLQGNFLGKFNIVVNGQKIDKWPTRKGKEVFAYLLFNYKQPVYRDVLMETFWPNSIADCARNNLNVTLHHIRKMLQTIDDSKEYILFKDDRYMLNPELDICNDVEVFRKLWSRANSLEYEQGIEAAYNIYEKAAALYKGDFIEEELYQEWLSSEKENLKEIYLAILEKLSSYYSRNGQCDRVIFLCKKILERDNCREIVHRRVMRCYYQLGTRSLALKQYKKCEKILREELEVEPAQSTRDLYEAIKNDRLNTENGEKNEN